MIIIGEEEEKTNTISVRKRGDAGQANLKLTIEEFKNIISEEISKTLKPFIV